MLRILLERMLYQKATVGRGTGRSSAIGSLKQSGAIYQALFGEGFNRMRSWGI